MFRIKSYGDTSFFRKTLRAANEAAAQIMERNGCGCIERRNSAGRWQIAARFEPWYGIVAAS